MARKKKGEVRVPEYKNNPSSVSITVYDMQGDPITSKVEDALSDIIEEWVKRFGAKSLAISVNRG